MPKISVILIAKDAEAHLAECLDSVAFADEIIVLENGSRDSTVSICLQKGVKLHQSSDWPGFGPQKNRVLALATGDWVLSLDTDEIVPEALANEIRDVINQPDPGFAAYALPRQSNYCGRFMQYSGWWPDPVIRLFRRGQARFSDDLVHERLLVDGAIGALTTPMLHYSFDSLEQVLAKVNSYSTAGARQRHAQGKRASLGKAILHGWWAFVRTYLLKRGFMDGREGFMLAVSNAEGVYYRYLKQMLLAERKS